MSYIHNVHVLVHEVYMYNLPQYINAICECNLNILILGKEKEKRKVSGKENQRKGKKEKRKGFILDVTSQPCVPNTTSTNDSDDSPSEAVDPEKSFSPTNNQPADIASQSTLLPPHP